jgi:predicted HicB family RNase H-like nuclease
MSTDKIRKLASQYVKFVEWSDEDKVYIGRCPELFGGGVHGDDPVKVFEELCIAVEDVLENQLKAQKKPSKSAPPKYSGRFVLRVDPHLHRAIAVQAEKNGVSLNQYILKKLQSA